MAAALVNVWSIGTCTALIEAQNEYFHWLAPDAPSPSLYSSGALATTGFRGWSSLPEFDLLRGPQCIVDFDAKISDCARQLAVAK